MKRSAIACFLVLLAALHGCASVSVDRAKDLSSAAIQYSDATVAVVDLAIDASIDADSVPLARSVFAPKSQAERDKLRDDLAKLDTSLMNSTARYVTLKHSVGATKAFFVALQDLANGSPAEAAEAAVKSLAEQVNSLNAALEASDAKPKLSDEKIAALSGLAKLVAAQVHGAKVAKAMQEHAATIGKALALQEQLLVVSEDDIRNGLNQTNNLFYVDRVRTPYETGKPGADWVSDRKTYIKVAAVGQTPTAVGSAREAAGRMQTVWQRILSGDYSAKEVQASLQETQDLLDAANALKQASKTSKSSV